MNKIIKWVKSLFKKKLPEGLYNIHHPDIVGKVELAFTVKGIDYYRFKPDSAGNGQDFNMPVGRYKFIDEKLSEVDILMDMKTLKAYIAALKKHLDASKGIVNLFEAFKIIYAMETRCELAFEPETVRQLAAVVYFDETEDLRDFDKDYAQKKISFWEENGDYSFFLTRPIGELLGLQTSSLEHLRRYISQAQQIIKDLTLDLETPLPENS